MSNGSAGHTSDPTQADSIFRSALWCGGLILLLGLACLYVGPIKSTILTLVICSGLGIILGAFGSSATIRYKGVTIAGVAAITVVLLWVVEYYLHESMVRVQILGVNEKTQLSLDGDELYPGSFRRRNKRYEFVVVAREIRSPDLSLTIILPPALESTEGREVPFECIPRSAVNDFLGTHQTIQWRFDAATDRLLGVKGGPVEIGPCKDLPGVSSFATLGQFSPISVAAAQQARSIAELAKDLESEVPSIRRLARKELSAAGLQSIELLMTEWKRNPTSYRIRLGVSVSLAEFLRHHPEQRKAASAALKEDDLELLVAAAADPDKTIRIYASEFLFALSDRRVAAIAQQKFVTASEDGKSNLAAVLRGTTPSLSAGEQKELAGSLNTWKATAEPKLRREIDRTLEKL